MSLRNFTTPKKRREFLEKELKNNFSVFSSVDLEENENVHCENLIGGVNIPLGIAGPILINKKERYLPLATTEGALVASVSRGCKALCESGGVVSHAIYHGQTRGSVFRTETVKKGEELKKWIEKNKTLLSKTAQKTSTHITYLGVKIKIIGEYTYVRFQYDTEDAMGMNMVTLASEKISGEIEKELKIKCLAVAGNFDIDKKPSFLNLIEGRGFEVSAECIITEKVLSQVLHTTAKNIYDVWLAKCMIGSYAAGSLGYNSHFANIVASLFIATGQDPAHVVEGSQGITICEVRGKDLYIAVNIPSLQVGIVGGGTALPAQRKALELMGFSKKAKSFEFAEIAGGAVLAGELSLIAAITTKSLGSAHKRLGRSKK